MKFCGLSKLTQSLSHNDITHASKWKDIAAFVADNAHPLNLLISPLCFHPDLPLLITASDVFPHLASFLYPDVLPHSHLKCFPLIYLCSICYASMGLTCTCTFITPDVLPPTYLYSMWVLPLMFLYHNWQQDLPLSHLMSPSEMDSENPGLFTSWISWSVPKKKS